MYFFEAFPSILFFFILFFFGGKSQLWQGETAEKLVKYNALTLA